MSTDSTTAAAATATQSATATVQQSSSLSDEQPSLITVKHVERGANKRTGKLCFVPKGYDLNPKIVDLVQTTWGLELPNLIVQCDMGTAHPTELGTSALMHLPQFEEWLMHSKKHHGGRASVTPAATGAGTGAEDEVAVSANARKLIKRWASSSSVQPEPALDDVEEGGGIGSTSSTSNDVPTAEGGSTGGPTASQESSSKVNSDDVELINELIFQKLITVMSAVVDACAMSNNWIIVNRLDGNSSATAELMLEFALERTAAKPTVRALPLVVLALVVLVVLALVVLVVAMDRRFLPFLAGARPRLDQPAGGVHLGG